MNDLMVIGRAEKVRLPDICDIKVHAKIDTGADKNSIWVSSVEEKDGKLGVVFFGPQSSYYDGRRHTFKKGEYGITRVSSSFGHKELRYTVKIKIKVKNKLVNGTFTLSDRSSKLYPVLIGRSLLHKKFVVDVSRGAALKSQEQARKLELKTYIESLNKE
jgi:hypothetical protein